MFSIPKQHNNNPQKYHILPLLVLIASLTATFTSWNYIDHNVRQNLNYQFETDVANINELITNRLDIYINMLRSGKALLAAKGPVDRHQWSTFINRLDVTQNYPGIQAIAFVPIVDKSELANFEASIRLNEYPDFMVDSSNQNQIYTPVLFIEPYDNNNSKAIGYDMYQEEIRRQAIENAMMANSPSITGKVNLVADKMNAEIPGFIVYIPVTKDMLPSGVIIPNSTEYYGFVTALFRANDLIENIYTESEWNIGLEIYDTANIDIVTNNNLLYRSHPSGDAKPQFSKVDYIDIAGHTWTVKYNSLDNFQSKYNDRNLPPILVISGSMLSLLLYAITYLLGNSRNAAISYAAKINKQLTKEKNNIALEKLRDEAILASIGDGLILADLNKQVITLNQATKTLCQLKTTNQSGQSLKDVCKIIIETGSECQLTNQIIDRIYQEATTCTVILNSFLIKPDGTKLAIAYSATPARDSSKQIVGYVILIRDVTKEREVDTLKNEFVSIVSHQLRTPLTGIKWLTELLLTSKYGELNVTQQKLVNNIFNSNEKLIELVNDLLNISRIETGNKFVIQKEQVDFAKLIADQIKEEIIFASKNNIAIETAEDFPTEIIMRLDTKKIKQVLHNLLTNAIKYSNPQGKIKIGIHREENSTNSVVLYISDNGIGIPVDQQAKVFEKFYRAENALSRQTDGNGLGLYIVKSIVEAHKGKIWFKSKENQGTTFYIELPKE